MSQPRMDTPLSASDHALSVVVSVAFLVIIPAWYILIQNDAKYVLYLLAAVILVSFVVTHNRAMSFNPSGIAAVAIFGAIGVVATLTSGTTEYTQRDVVFVLSYLSIFAIAFRPAPFVLVAMLVSVTIGLIVDAAQDGINWKVDLLNSEGFLESVLAFPLGVLALGFLYHRRWTLTILSFILMIVAFKRIAVGGFIVGAAAMMVFERIDQPRIERALALMAMIGTIIVALAARQIFDIAAMLLNFENVSANAISLGRADAIIALERVLDDASNAQHLFGMGIGHADAVVRNAVGLTNPHNDWLKLRFDYGYVGLAVFAWLFYRLFRDSRLGLIMLVYTSILFITDNVFVYVFYFIPAAILAKTDSFGGEASLFEPDATLERGSA